MKRILSLIVLVALSTLLLAEIQVEQGLNEWRVYQNGRSRNLYFSVEGEKVRVGNSNTSTNLEVAGTLTVSGRVIGGTTFGAALTVGEDDAGYDVIFYGDTTGKKLTWDTSSDMLDIDGIMKVHNRPVSTDTYALEVKCDYAQASGVGQGALQTSTRIYPTVDSTTVEARGGYFQCQCYGD